MTHGEIEQAIKRARRGMTQYLAIMELLPAVNVAEDRRFQRLLNGFYRIRQRPAEWYTTYYSLMQEWKGTRPAFADVLDRLWESLGRYEPSFSSKLVATLDPDQPVWDRYVLENTQTRAPAYTSSRKLTQAKVAYQRIQDWYRGFLTSEDGALVVRVFNASVPEHARITDLKKVDFVLWQTRGDKPRAVAGPGTS